LNRAWYEFEHHAPLLLKDGGLPLPGLKYILTATPATKSHAPHTVDAAAGIDEQHALVLEYTDYMTLDCEVPDEVFARLRKVFNEREVVELTATVGAYNCVSRFLVALDVSERNGSAGRDEALKHVSQELAGLTPASR
jgi:alkylhydroperoxidase family enzyme